MCPVAQQVPDVSTSAACRLHKARWALSRSVFIELLTRYNALYKCHADWLKVTKTVYLDVTEGGQPLGRIEIGLFGAPGLQGVHFSTTCGLLAHKHTGVCAITGV